jgi:hypothetical protein
MFKMGLTKEYMSIVSQKTQQNFASGKKEPLIDSAAFAVCRYNTDVFLITTLFCGMGVMSWIEMCGA